MYANVIIDISHEKLDRTFQYRIPERLIAEITAGVQVLIPFGNSKVPRKGYVIEVREKAEFDPEKTKEIIDVDPSGMVDEGTIWLHHEPGVKNGPSGKTAGASERKKGFKVPAFQRRTGTGSGGGSKKAL